MGKSNVLFWSLTIWKLPTGLVQLKNCGSSCWLLIVLFNSNHPAGLRVVKVRAQVMQQACQQHPSGMVSIVGPAAVDLQALFDAAKHWSLTKGTKEPVACLANYLFPGGWVLGGDRSSIDYILKYGKVKVCEIIPRDLISNNNTVLSDYGLEISFMW